MQDGRSRPWGTGIVVGMGQTPGPRAGVVGGWEEVEVLDQRFLSFSSSLLKNPEIGAFSVFLPWGSERWQGVVVSGRRPYAASSVGMRIRL
jgi:hypothetical protein